MTREDMLEIMQRRQAMQKRLDDATTQHTIEIMSTKTTNDTKEEETTMTQTTNTTYTEKNGRYYKIENGKTTRIGKAEYEAAQKTKEDAEWQAKADAEIKARADKEAEDAKATEDTFNGKTKTTRTKEKAEKKEENQPKAKKPRKSKDIAFEDEEQAVTLTAKQVDFILHLSDSCFWEKGLDSTLWCDVLCDEIKGQFEGKPMTIGAMISTLCEKGLAIRTKEKRENRKTTTFALTIKGKLIASKVGLK